MTVLVQNNKKYVNNKQNALDAYGAGDLAVNTEVSTTAIVEK